MSKGEIGRIAFRVEGNWWVAYYALPDTLEEALELARIQMSIVQDIGRKQTFMNLCLEYIAEVVPAFQVTERRPAPEHEKAGRS